MTHIATNRSRPYKALPVSSYKVVCAGKSFIPFMRNEYGQPDIIKCKHDNLLFAKVYKQLSHRSTLVYFKVSIFVVPYMCDLRVIVMMVQNFPSWLFVLKIYCQ